MTIGQKIRAERIKRGWTQKKLGEECGMADSAIRRYESDRGNPTIGTLRRIAYAFDIPAWDLLDDEMLEEMGVTEEIKHRVKHSCLVEQSMEAMSDLLEQLNLDGMIESLKRVKAVTEIPEYKYKPFPENGEDT